MVHFKLNPTQELAFKIKLRCTHQFNFHTNFQTRKMNPIRIPINKVEPKKSLFIFKILITRILEGHNSYLNELNYSTATIFFKFIFLDYLTF